MKMIEVYRGVRKNLIDSRLVVTRIEVPKMGKGSYRRKNKYGKRDE